jgi:predicted dehydrogenase
MSGIRIPERRFLEAGISTEADDNTILLLDFGGGVLAIAYGTAAGTHTDQFGAGLYFGTRGTIEGILLNGEPFDFPGRELMGGAPPSDRNAQVRVLPHVVGRHRNIEEQHVFEDIMQLVESVSRGTPTPVSAEHARHVIDIIESGYRSAEIGARQDLTTSFDLAPLST